MLPHGQRSTVSGIDTADGPLTEAAAGKSVTLLLADDIDISRGDLIAIGGQRAAGQRRDRRDDLLAVRQAAARGRPAAGQARHPHRARDRVQFGHSVQRADAVQLAEPGCAATQRDRPGELPHRRAVAARPVHHQPAYRRLPGHRSRPTARRSPPVWSAHHCPYWSTTNRSSATANWFPPDRSPPPKGSTREDRQSPHAHLVDGRCGRSGRGTGPRPERLFTGELDPDRQLRPGSSGGTATRVLPERHPRGRAGRAGQGVLHQGAGQHQADPAVVQRGP